MDDGRDGDDKFYGDDIEYAQFPDSRSTRSLVENFTEVILRSNQHFAVLIL